MNRTIMAALTAAMLCGSAALAAPASTAQAQTQAQLQAQVAALQAEVAALQRVSDIQPGCGPGATIPSGG